MIHADYCNHSCRQKVNYSCRPICNHTHMDRSPLSALIEKVRTDAGDSPAKAAEKIGVSRQGYMKWESGDTANMKLVNLLAFCDKYKINVGLFLRGEIVKTDSTRLSQSIAYSMKEKVTELSANEPDINIRKLIDAYRVADEKDREQMLWLANRALDVFEKRSEKKD